MTQYVEPRYWYRKQPKYTNIQNKCMKNGMLDPICTFTEFLRNMNLKRNDAILW